MNQSYFTRYMKQSVITVFFCITALFAIGQAQISVNKIFDRNKMVCAGFYSLNNNSFDANGIVLFNLEKDATIFRMVSHEIPIDIIN